MSTLKFSDLGRDLFSAYRSEDRRPNFGLPKGYCLGMPLAGSYTWSGHCIEGGGVEPDVVVENTPESLAKCADTQLQEPLELVKSFEANKCLGHATAN